MYVLFLAGGVLAFLLILVEIVLVQLTSSLTLSVLGVLKTLLQVRRCAALGLLFV